MRFIQDSTHKAELVRSIQRQILAGVTRQDCKQITLNALRRKTADPGTLSIAYFGSDMLIDEVYDDHEKNVCCRSDQYSASKKRS